MDPTAMLIEEEKPPRQPARASSRLGPQHFGDAAERTERTADWVVDELRKAILHAEDDRQPGEVPDPTRLHLVTRLNGEEVQHTGIDDLIFDIPTLVSYCSEWTPLVAGDVISTGTPEGVGFARKPPLWMKPGDVVEVEIDGGIGVLRNPIIAES
jgi:hypothetical protein